MTTPPIVTLDHQAIQEMQTSLPALVEQAQECEIVNKEDYIASTSILDRIDKKRRTIAEFFENPARQANDLHKFITGLRATLLKPLVQAETVLKNRRADWRTEQENIRRAEEEEKRRLAKEEQERQALQQATDLAAIGETEAAEIVIDRAASSPPPPVVVQSNVPKEKGISVRKKPKFRILNEALIKREFLIPDESKIQSLVTSLGFDAVAVVGAGSIEVYEEEVESIRRKANG